MSDGRATVAELWRYPVKSMQGERIEAADVTEGGIVGDRAYAVIDPATGKVGSAKHPRLWGSLLQCRARFIGEPGPGAPLPPVAITLPDGTETGTEDPEVDDRLSALFHRPVELTTVAPEGNSYLAVWPDLEGVMPDDFREQNAVDGSEHDGTVTDLGLALASPPGSFFDVSALHVVTTATLARLGELEPGSRFEVARYRPNIVIDTDGEAFTENGWTGSTVRFGPELTASVLIPTMRCIMTTLAQGDLPRDNATLRTVAAHNRIEIPGLGTWSCVGAYATVATPGRVSVGDDVNLDGAVAHSPGTRGVPLSSLREMPPGRVTLMSELFLRTLRDDPADSELDSHRLLVRGGFIRRVASGVYSWLPLGNRVLRAVEQIVREEMDAAGAQETVLPIIQPLELWERSGRDAAYGPMMFRLRDRKETGFCLAPTAEEVVTTLVAGEYSSYRDLPVNLYQINWKYRDELRPRFGVLRAREFLMKDAYSFDRDLDGCQASYDAMYAAYEKVFTRCGLTFRSVKAQSGEIGGDTSQEFMAVAAVGEDAFVWCEHCDYAANTEAATKQELPEKEAPADAPAMEKLHTPDLPGIDQVAKHLKTKPNRLLKAIAFDVDGDLGLVIVPGNREVNEFVLDGLFPGSEVRLLTDADFAARPDLPKGYIGPDFHGAKHVIADSSVRAPHPWITGANEVDHHVRGSVLGRDFTPTQWVEIAVVEPGDACPKCGQPLRIDRGIEVGHVFQLGTKYTEALGALYTDEDGEQHPMVMGCYGIGVSRIIAAVVEEFHDDNGIAWPAALAPFDVHLIAMPGDESLAEAAKLADELTAAGLAVLYDDREVRPGVKFADADLVGMPVQLIVGAKGIEKGIVERKFRATGERDEIPRGDAVAVLAAGAVV